MFKLSKESRRTFLALLFIPFIWVALNHFGTLDYLKIKSVDLRKQYRGEIPQDFAKNSHDLISVENNKTVPRIPKLVYVNFDSATLAMDGVGERPWDRAFFRDTAFTLLEKGRARSIGFDFGFTPKSMSKMVPRKNSYRSDLAMGQLVDKFPNQVILGCLYSGVQTPFVKPVNASAFAPLFSEGYSENSSDFTYPESPTYPLQNYKNGKYIGRLGSFSVPPFRAVDEIPRWAPLWFPGGGKAHAYNLLGGKQNVLELESSVENKTSIDDLKSELSKNLDLMVFCKKEIAEAEAEHSTYNQKKIEIESGIDRLQKLKDNLKGLGDEITTLKGTLKAVPTLATTLRPQIDERISKRGFIYWQVLSVVETGGWENVYSPDEIQTELAEINTVIGNFKETLKTNPGLSAVINPQIEGHLSRRVYLLKQIEALGKPVADQEILDVLERLSGKQALKDKELLDILPVLADTAVKLNKARDQLTETENTVENIQFTLSKLQGLVDTELVETNHTLRLVYKRAEGDKSAGVLVDSLPNEVPLFRNENFFTLGLEALLAYYGIGPEQVEISQNRENMVLYNLSGEVLLEAPLTEGQWIEVNWFSSWSQLSTVDVLIRKAKKDYSDGDIEAYLSVIPKIFRLTLDRVENLKVLIGNEGLIQAMTDLGLENELIDIAQKLLVNSSDKLQDLPGLNELIQVLDGIAYYFIPASIESEYNPMCGMVDILNYGRYHDTVSAKINELEKAIEKGQQKIKEAQDALSKDPQNPEYKNFIKVVKELIANNKKTLLGQKEEMARIESFFNIFNDSIVLIGPEEATFQDLAPTPFDQSSVPKVSVHGNLIKTLTHQEYLHRLPIRADHLATLGVCLVMAFLAVYQGKRASIVQASGLILLIAYVYFGFETFSQTHVIWPITVPACAGLSTSFIGLAAMVVIEQKAKGRLKGMFGSYVSSDLVEEMVASGKEPSLGGEETAITAFFSDVQAFSSFSELLTPTGLVDLMNEYLTEMTNILQEERGTLDKYIGDAIVAMYGAPIPMEDHAYQAVRTSILMQQRQIALREKWVPEVEKWGKCHGLVTQMQTRIGCNTGTATVGNMGALDRFNYTMMGDMVNLAARCESGAKAYGAYIMVTEETKLASEKTKDDIAFRYLDRIVVKGRSQPVAMYEPTGFLSELTQETQDCLDCFQQGIDKYLLQDWDGALGLFEKAKGMEPNKPGVTPGVKDNPSMILIDRCKVMRENPPAADWDGVYVMTTK